MGIDISSVSSQITSASQMKTRQKTTAKFAQESTSLTSTGTEAANKLFDDYYASKGE